MIDVRDRAKQLLEEYELCCRAKPKSNAVNIQLDKDIVKPWAELLKRMLAWGSDNDVAEAIYQLESRLTTLKEKLVFEVLKHGSV